MGKFSLGISRHLRSSGIEPPTYARKLQRNSLSHHGPESHTPWDSRNAFLRRISARNTRKNSTEALRESDGSRDYCENIL